MSTPTRQDDIERIVRILSDGPKEGLSIEEIQRVTKTTGETWSFLTINNLLCALGSQVAHAKVRIKTGKITRYWLKGTQ